MRKTILSSMSAIIILGCTSFKVVDVEEMKNTINQNEAVYDYSEKYGLAKRFSNSLKRENMYRETVKAIALAEEERVEKERIEKERQITIAKAKAEEEAKIRAETVKVSKQASESSDYEVYTVTAYTAGYESTGKRPGHREYGITASGKKVKEGVTAACPKEMPFGTKLYIPHFDKTFVCQDRGGAIKGKKLDIYFKDLKAAQKHGKQKLKVKIIEKGKES